MLAKKIEETLKKNQKTENGGLPQDKEGRLA
jgi:hypothetical protein